jgi:hypothetical protein
MSRTTVSQRLLHELIKKHSVTKHGLPKTTVQSQQFAYNNVLRADHV